MSVLYLLIFFACVNRLHKMIVGKDICAFRKHILVRKQCVSGTTEREEIKNKHNINASYSEAHKKIDNNKNVIHFFFLVFIISC